MNIMEHEIDLQGDEEKITLHVMSNVYQEESLREMQDELFVIDIRVHGESEELHTFSLEKGIELRNYLNLMIDKVGV